MGVQQECMVDGWCLRRRKSLSTLARQSQATVSARPFLSMCYLVFSFLFITFYHFPSTQYQTSPGEVPDANSDGLMEAFSLHNVRMRGTVGVTIHVPGNLAERVPKAGKDQASRLSSKRQKPSRLSCLVREW